tara:strand:- start:308 stop:481 length:174 start_codon:yes stop_codon:yes gene_type:complete
MKTFTIFDIKRAFEAGIQSESNRKRNEVSTSTTALPEPDWDEYKDTLERINESDSDW